MFVEPIIQENIASSVSAEKKQFVVYGKKKNSDCADITKIKDEKIQIFVKCNQGWRQGGGGGAGPPNGHAWLPQSTSLLF